MLIVSKITSKAQTTVPRAVRDLLRLRPGDSLVYELAEDGVRVRKLAAAELAWLRGVEAGLEEWDGESDAEAYAGL